MSEWCGICEEKNLIIIIVEIVGFTALPHRLKVLAMITTVLHCNARPTESVRGARYRS